MKKKSISKEKRIYGLFFTLSLITLIATSCASKKDILYFQDIESFPLNTTDRAKYQLRIVPNDNLLITVSALNPAAAEPFNVVNLSGTLTGNMEYRGYLVDEKGEINFPVIGKVVVGGLTKAEAEKLLSDDIARYITNPVVNIRYMNYKISILGEVNRPGTYTVNDEKVSITEALSLAGDLTIYGRRQDVQIYRMENGEKKYYTVDLTNPAVFYSPSYYLQQNDIVYVKPNMTRVRSASQNQNLSLIISSVTFVITVLSFVINNTKK